jgi:hypothetical protein
MSDEIADLIGMARMKATCSEISGIRPIRFAGVNSDYPIQFRHVLNVFAFGNAIAGSTSDGVPVGLAYWSIVKRGLRISTTRARAQWGVGAYAWPAGHPVGSRAYVDIEVPPGTLIEELHVPNQGVFYRLLPHSGECIAVSVLGTNIPSSHLADYKDFF